MKLLDSMYICTTPFQIMSAISLVMSRKEKADLYIDAQFEGAEELAERIRARKIFQEIRVLKDVPCIKRVREAGGQAARYKALMSMYRNIDAAAEELLIPERSYRILYATHNVFVANIIMLYISKRDILTKVFYFDDGEGSYDERDLFRTSLPDRMAKRFTLGKRKFRSVRRYYMYSPELFRSMHPENRLPVFRLPRFHSDPKILEAISDIFEAGEEKGIREPVVILDVLRGVALSEEDSDRLEQLYGRLLKEFGEDRVVIKRHPRDTAEHVVSIKEYPYPTTPFEITCLASDPSKMTLITVLSTATTMPKMLMDKEPRIVLLYKLFRKKQGTDGDRDHFFDMTRKIYDDPDRILIPETEEELDQIIAKIREELQ